MAVAAFLFHEGCAVVELAFRRNDGGGTLVRRLLVDSGFTGKSAFVLAPSDSALLGQKPAPASDTAGAIQGRQRRIWVTCEVLSLGFHRALPAIVGDLTPLGLPAGIHGMAGLAFLSRFIRWGG